MSITFPDKVKKINVFTGNILNLTEVKKKVGQNLTDELVESLRITLTEWQADNSEVPSTETIQVKLEKASLLINAGEERKDLKVGLKLFLPVTAPNSNNVIKDALDCLLSELGTGHVESLVLAQAGRQAEGVSVEQQTERLAALWRLMETEVQTGRVLSAGVSDLDTDQFISLHTSAQVKPSIVQINLATCCVVPPALQTFTKEHEVQLLTHSDPLELMPAPLVDEVFGAGWRLSWVLRLQVHVKCRGVLASKGYIVCIEKS